MIASYAIQVIIPVLLLIMPASAIFFSSTNFIKLSRGQMTKGHSLKNLTNVGRIECGQKCMGDDDCTAFSVGTSQRCQLLGGGSQAFNVEETPGTEFFYLVSYISTNIY